MNDPQRQIIPTTGAIPAHGLGATTSEALDVLDSVSAQSFQLRVAPSDRAQKIFLERKLSLTGAFREALKNTPENEQDHVYVQSEEFFDLALMAWQAAQQTRHREKIDLYGKILAGAIPFQNRTANDPEAYMNVIMTLSLQELGVAKAVYHVSQTWRRYPEDTDDKRTLVLRLPDDPWNKLGPHCPHINQEDLPFYLSRLVSVGLIQVYGTTTSMNYPGGCEYVVPKTFSKLMHYAKEKWGEDT